MKISVGSTGSIIKGNTLDCAVAPLERMLRDYDPQLYVTWNAKKLRGWGCWEVRRKPEEKALKASDITIFQGNTYVFPKYHEQGLVHHVMDVPYLNYLILVKLKQMDLWSKKEFGYKGKKFSHEIDYLEAKYDERVEKNADDEKNYMIKQHKTLINDFKEYVLAGGDPNRLADHWGK